MEKDNTNIKFLAFVKDDSDIKILSEFASENGLGENSVQKGDIGAAISYLNNKQPPETLLIEIESADSAPKQFDELANFCSPETKVIVVGKINEYSFYCWLKDIGISNYLLMPLKKETVANIYNKAVKKPQEGNNEVKEPTKIFSIIGVRGGVGASTVALNLAGIFAKNSGKKVALVDLDAYKGTLSLMIDIEPSHGLRDALERPDRIDPLFIDRVMSKTHENLWVLSAEEPLQEQINIADATADSLIKELSNKYDIIIMDIPRYMDKFCHGCLKYSDSVILVAELSLQSIRDSLRFSDFIADILKMPRPMVIANRVGAGAKNEIGTADFEKGIMAKLEEKISYHPDIFMSIGSDIPAVHHAKHNVVKPLYSIAKKLIPTLKEEDIKVEKGLFDFMKKKENKDKE
ncbi:MAG: AAA family ATPase [Rickettsiales bacterium]